MAEKEKTNLNKTELLKVLPVEEDEIWYALSILLDPEGFEVFEIGETTYALCGVDCSIAISGKDTFRVEFEDNGYARDHYAAALYQATRIRMKLESRAMTKARNYFRMNEYAQHYREAKRLEKLAQGFRDAKIG